MAPCLRGPLPRGVLALVLCVWFAVTPGAQSPFRSAIETVLVTVTVTDSNGRLITGLTKGDFEIFEDGEPQPVTQFTDQRVPVSLGVLLDASDSMRGRPIVDARSALDRFVATCSSPKTRRSSPHSITCRASSPRGRALRPR